MLATIRFNGVILVTRVPQPEGTLDKSEFDKFEDVAGHYRAMAIDNHGRVQVDVVAVFSIGKNAQQQEVVSLTPFPMASIDCPFSDVQVVDLHADYKAHVEQTYRQKTSGIII